MKNILTLDIVEVNIYLLVNIELLSNWLKIVLDSVATLFKTSYI
jgi:hypothetical protein